MCARVVFEEVAIRAYGIERVQELTGNQWLAGAVSLAVFSFAHLSHWGVAQVLVAGAVGLPLTVFYIWRRDLASNILALDRRRDRRAAGAVNGCIWNPRGFMLGNTMARWARLWEYRFGRR